MNEKSIYLCIIFCQINNDFVMSICFNGGTFVESINQCICPLRFTGNQCLNPICDHGIPLYWENRNSNSIQFCLCDINWEGDFCELAYCTTKGVRTLNGRCLCEENYTGFGCERRVCHNGGTLMFDNKCRCNPEWQGEFCLEMVETIEETTHEDYTTTGLNVRPNTKARPNGGPNVKGEPKSEFSRLGFWKPFIYVFGSIVAIFLILSLLFCCKNICCDFKRRTVTRLPLARDIDNEQLTRRSHLNPPPNYQETVILELDPQAIPSRPPNYFEVFTESRNRHSL